MVGGLVAIFYFPINIGLIIIPIDVHIFQVGVALAHQPVGDDTAPILIGDYKNPVAESRTKPSSRLE